LVGKKTVGKNIDNLKLRVEDFAALRDPQVKGLRRPVRQENPKGSKYCKKR
jgi:hypothetical protein